MKSYVLKKIINRRETAKCDIEYLIKWKEYEPKLNIWRNLSEMNDAINLMRVYEKIMNCAILKRYVQNRTLLQKINEQSLLFLKFIASHDHSFDVILVKFKMIILASFSVDSFSFLQKTFISFHRSSRLLLSLF